MKKRQKKEHQDVHDSNPATVDIDRIFDMTWKMASRRIEIWHECYPRPMVPAFANTGSLMRLMQLASPALPVGAFSYSQGLEWAVEDKWVYDQASALAWIGDTLRFSAAAIEAPTMIALMRVWQLTGNECASRVAALNECFLAQRETAELRAETLQMGHSLARLLRDLDEIPTTLKATLASLGEVAYPTVWAAAAAFWNLDEHASAQAYLWASLENQVMAAVKLVPLGQTAGQKILLALADRIPALASAAMTHAGEEWRNFAPGLALASSRHETQYTRLFRS
jgi:urease accessory protein